MQKAAVILIMVILCLGLTQPGGYMQYCNLEEQYEQCSREDHDITPLDFVFEHLLNLESIVNLIEGEHEYAGTDEPHMPFQTPESSPSVFLALPATYPDAITPFLFPHEGVNYPIAGNNCFLSGFCADILRPPIC